MEYSGANFFTTPTYRRQKCRFSIGAISNWPLLNFRILCPFSAVSTKSSQPPFLNQILGNPLVQTSHTSCPDFYGRLGFTHQDPFPSQFRGAAAAVAGGGPELDRRDGLPLPRGRLRQAGPRRHRLHRKVVQAEPGQSINAPEIVQGDPSAHGLGYVEINSFSLGVYPETELSQHNPVREQMGHPLSIEHSVQHGNHRKTHELEKYYKCSTNT